MDAFIKKLQDRRDLTQDEVQAVMKMIIDGQVPHQSIAEFLLALNAKTPTIEEITGAAKILRQYSLEVLTNQPVILDTCGTGGDKKGTFNISTISAFVIAAAGVVVAKHGNRSVSSRCGSADLLQELGVNIQMEQGHLGECLDKIGIAFLFAPNLHPAMKNVAPVRKSLGVETIFNILGPLLNPAKATHQVMGIFNRDYVEPLAIVLKNLGLRRALVVHGHDGLDEVTTTAKTFVSEYDGREILSYEINPVELGYKLAKPEDLKGGDIATNTSIALDILKGKTGPKRDIVVLNAACGLYCSEYVQSIPDGIKISNEILDSRKAYHKLEELIAFTNRIAP